MDRSGGRERAVGRVGTRASVAILPPQSGRNDVPAVIVTNDVGQVGPCDAINDGGHGKRRLSDLDLASIRVNNGRGQFVGVGAGEQLAGAAAASTAKVEVAI